MSMIKGKNTKPEIIVRKYLFHCGFRFRVNVKRLPGTPDIVLRPPRTRVEWWTEKLNRNKARDARVREELRAMGWNTMVIWECQLKPKERQATLENVVRLLEKTYVESTYHAKFTPAYPLLEEEELPKVAEEEISYESAHHY